MYTYDLNMLLAGKPDLVMKIQIKLDVVAGGATVWDVKCYATLYLAKVISGCLIMIIWSSNKGKK